MGKKSIRTAGLLLAAAAVLRVSASGSLTEAELSRGEWKQLGELTLALGTGILPPEPQKRPTVWVLHYIPPAEEAAPAVPPEYLPEQAGAIALRGNAGYTPDVPALLCSPLPFTAGEAPQVLVYHTHTSEAYTQTAGWSYTESDPLRTTQTEYSVARVGQALAEALEQGGLSCIHDKTCHDHPEYNGAYARALSTVEKDLEEAPSLQILLDVHRDATENAAGEPTGETVTAEDRQAARCMLVVGTDAGGLSHDHWQDNLSLALKWQVEAEALAPGLMKPIDLRAERFNQHLRPGALLVEIGSTGNTLPEALAAAELLGRALLRVLGT